MSAFDEANEAASKGEVDKYLVRAGFGTAAAVLGWTGELLVKLSGESDFFQELLNKYDCTEFDWETFPKDFV